MKFAVDLMLGTLSRWLRIMGYDTTFNKKLSLVEFVEETKKDDRILLTRNSRIYEIKDFKNFYYVKGNHLDEQLKEIIKNFNLDVKSNIFSRCLDCNIEVKRIEKEKVKSKVPLFVYKNFNVFFECPKCKKIFWCGSHYKNTLTKLKNILRLT